MQNNYDLLSLERNREDFTSAFLYFVGEKNGANDAIDAKVAYKVWKHFPSFPRSRGSHGEGEEISMKLLLKLQDGEDLAQRWYLHLSSDRQWMAFTTKVILFVMQMVSKKLIDCPIGKSVMALKARWPRSVVSAANTPWLSVWSSVSPFSKNK